MVQEEGARTRLTGELVQIGKAADVQLPEDDALASDGAVHAFVQREGGIVTLHSFPTMTRGRAVDPSAYAAIAGTAEVGFGQRMWMGDCWLQVAD